MNKLPIILFLVIGFNSLSQKENLNCLKDSLGIYSEVDVEPMFIDGIHGLHNYLKKVWHGYMDEFNQPISSYKIVLIINENGEVEVISINEEKLGNWNDENEFNYTMLKSMPKWTSGICNNQRVKSYYTINLKIDFY
jgi:hypothetical protein